MQTRKEAAGKAAKQSCVAVLCQVEDIRPGFLAELEAVKNISGIMPFFCGSCTHGHR